VFEPKIDGFRALAYVDGHHCRLVSRNGHVFKSWTQLAEEIAHAVRADSAVIFGEVCCLEPDGRSNFKKLLFRREWPHFSAFDLLARSGRDMRAEPLLQRKRLLLKVLPKIESRLLYPDHVVERGRDFYQLACEHDVEGVVAKWRHGRYQSEGTGTSWLKIKNAGSQALGRRELFEARRDHRRRRRGYGTPELRLV
jgi:bifunctional non-homologous end joining protein LigD